MTEIKVFDYENPSLFLKDAWNKKRVFNKNFTLRAWAKQLGISSFGTLHQMIKGARPIPKKYVVAISKSLNLDPKESLYLETLIDYEKARTLKLKEHYAERLKSLAPGEKLSLFEIESFHCLKNPLNGAIIEMTSLSDFKADPVWIKERITVKATVTEVKESLELLLSLKLISVDENGKLKRTYKNLHTKQDVQNQALREYHRNVMKLASEEIERQDIVDREYNATAMGVRKSDLPAMKEALREFISEFISKFEATDGASEEIYQLSTQLFGLTNNKQEKLQ